MSGDTHTSKHESADDQIKRVNRLIDYLTAKKYPDLEDKDEPMALPYNELVAITNVNKSSLYQRGYTAKVSTYAGAKYEGGRGNKAIITVKPETWLRNRGKLDDVEEIGGGEMEEYVFKGDR